MKPCDAFVKEGAAAKRITFHPIFRDASGHGGFHARKGKNRAGGAISGPRDFALKRNFVPNRITIRFAATPLKQVRHVEGFDPRQVLRRNADALEMDQEFGVVLHLGGTLRRADQGVHLIHILMV